MICRLFKVQSYFIFQHFTFYYLFSNTLFFFCLHFILKSLDKGSFRTYKSFRLKSDCGFISLLSDTISFASLNQIQLFVPFKQIGDHFIIISSLATNNVHPKTNLIYSTRIPRQLRGRGKRILCNYCGITLLIHQNLSIYQSKR